MPVAVHSTEGLGRTAFAWVASSLKSRETRLTKPTVRSCAADANSRQYGSPDHRALIEGTFCRRKAARWTD